MYQISSDSKTHSYGRRSKTTVSTSVTDTRTGEIVINTNKQSRFNSSGMITGLLSIVFFILLAGSLFRALALPEGDTLNYLSLSGFLEAMQSVPSIDLSWISNLNPSTWSLSLPDYLSWLSVLLNAVMGVVQILSFIFVGIGQALLFIAYLLGFILGI